MSSTPGPSGWPQRRQLSVLAGTAGVILLIGLGYALFEYFSHPRNEGSTPPPPPTGSFHPTAQQLKTLTIEPVAVRDFVSQERTEGKIAVNADRATPVYSPYSGRVTRVIAN